MVICVIVAGLITSVISYALSELLKPKPKFENARPASVGDFDLPTSVEDRVITVWWGTVRQSGPNVGWWGDLSQTPIKEKIQINLWSSKRVTVGFRYNVGIMFGLGRGPIDGASDGIKKVWIGDTEVFSGSVSDGVISINEPTLFGGDEFGTGGWIGDIRMHPGTETQAVNAYLTPFHDPQLAFRGTVYGVLEKGYVGNSTSIKPVAFEMARFPNGLGLTSGRDVVNGADANPAAVLYELITNDEWGFNRSSTKIDVANFRTVGNTLHSEGNGWSMQLDREIPAEELQFEIERQIGGVMYLDQQTGKYRINLVRGGYDIATIPKIDDTNTLSIVNFSRGAWDDTTNQLRVKYADRLREYKETTVKADDLGNVRNQGGEVVSDTRSYPGCKDADLANGICSRDLKELSIPLAKATVEVDRTMWELVLGDVVSWSSDVLGLTDLAMRVARINRGTLIDGKIVLGLVQDVFEWDVGFFGAAPATLWVAPTQDVTAILVAESRVIEAPYAILRRDSTPNTGVFDRLWAFSRSPGGPEISFKMYQRNDPATPSGAFSEVGEVVGFIRIGELGTTINPADAMPTVTIRLDATPDTIANLLLEFSVVSDLDVGELNQMILIDDEFMGVESIVDQTTFIDLKNVWRGLMDTAPTTHAIDADVFLVFGAAGLSDGLITRGNVVDVQLRSVSRTDESTEGESTTVQFTMQDRSRSPYPPTEMLLNATRYDSSVDFDDLKSGGSTLDERGIELNFTRRDWRTQNEVTGIGTDAGTLDPSFPTEHNTRYQCTIFERAPSLAASIEAFWGLNEASGTRVDSAGSNDLTDVNTVTSIAGHSTEVGVAAVFVKTSEEELVRADTASISFADEDFEIAGFAYFDTLAGTHGVVAKSANFSGVAWEYAVWVSGSSFRFAISGDGTTGAAFTQISHSLTLSEDTWYWFSARHDSVNNTIELEVVAVANNIWESDIDILAHTAGCNDGVEPLRLGVIEGSVVDLWLNGRINAIGVWRRLLTVAERSVLFNLGNGQEWPLITPSRLGVQSAFASVADCFVSRTGILRTTNGRLPTDLRVEVLARHDRIGETFDALQTLDFDFARAAGTLDDDTNLGGALDTNVASNVFTAPDTGTVTYDVRIGTALPNGAVEVQINSGGWNSVIASGLTSGTFNAALNDSIELRHTESVASAETFVEIDPPTSTAGAYGVLIN